MDLGNAVRINPIHELLKARHPRQLPPRPLAEHRLLQVVSLKAQNLSTSIYLTYLYQMLFDNN